MSTMGHYTPETSTKGRYKVMIVDDSIVVRGVIHKILESDPQIDVVCMASTGAEAIEKLSSNDVDAVLLDIEMPVMDGLTALPKLLEIKPDLTVIMASTLTQRNAQISLQALSLGAKDYIPKPSQSTIETSRTEFGRGVVTKIKTLVDAARKKAQEASGVEATKPSFSLRPLPTRKPDALVFGSSTGGPAALGNVLRDLKGKIHCPIFVAQHMPPIFTKGLAEHLEEISGYTACEGQDGQLVESQKIYVAPGGYHMTVEVNDQNQKVIALNEDEAENYVRPSVNPLLRSVGKIYSGKALGIILTGMGSDSLQGAQEFVESGGSVITQDEETSIVWGMPGVVTSAGLSSAVLPLNEIPEKIHDIVNLW